MNDITIANQQPIDSISAGQQARALQPAAIAMLRNLYYDKAPDEMIVAAHALVLAKGVDHSMRPVYLVKTRDAWKDRPEKWELWPSMHLYRVIASRNMYAGRSRPKFGPEIEMKETIERRATQYRPADTETITVKVPEWAEVCVRRILPGGTVAKFYGIAYAHEFCKPKNDNWQRMPRHMLALRAEGFALRCAFPEVGGMPTWEEMRDQVMVGDDAGDDDAVEAAPMSSPRRIEPVDTVDAPVVASEPQSTDEMITPGMRKQILRKLEANGWALDVMTLALGREPAADLSDITKAEWAFTKERLAEYAEAAAKAAAAGVTDENA